MVWYYNDNGTIRPVYLYYNDNGTIKNEVNINMYKQYGNNYLTTPQRAHCLLNICKDSLGCDSLTGFNLPVGLDFQHWSGNTQQTRIGKPIAGITPVFIKNDIWAVDIRDNYLFYGGFFNGLSFVPAVPMREDRGTGFTISVTLDPFDINNVPNRQYIMIDNSAKMRLEKVGIDRIAYRDNYGRDEGLGIINPGQKTNITITINNTFPINLITVYKNNQVMTTFTWLQGERFDPATKLYINSKLNNEGPKFNNKYYRISVWNTCLTQTEIETLLKMDEIVP